MLTCLCHIKGEFNSNSLGHGESEANRAIYGESFTEGGTKITSRRRIQATKENNEKVRRPNKIKVLRNSVFVDANKQLQPISFC